MAMAIIMLDGLCLSSKVPQPIVQLSRVRFLSPPHGLLSAYASSSFFLDFSFFWLDSAMGSFCSLFVGVTTTPEFGVLPVLTLADRVVSHLAGTKPALVLLGSGPGAPSSMVIPTPATPGSNILLASRSLATGLTTNPNPGLSSLESSSFFH